MNPGLGDKHTAILFYDGGCPSPTLGERPENFDEVTKYQGLAFDLQRYRELATEKGGPILELSCGTGRIAIPLAREDFPVTGVDVSHGMLEQFRVNLARETPATGSNIAWIEQDVCQRSIGETRFELVIMAFNSLL